MAAAAAYVWRAAVALLSALTDDPESSPAAATPFGGAARTSTSLVRKAAFVTRPGSRPAGAALASPSLKTIDDAASELDSNIDPVTLLLNLRSTCSCTGGSSNGSHGRSGSIGVRSSCCSGHTPGRLSMGALLAARSAAAALAERSRLRGPGAVAGAAGSFYRDDREDHVVRLLQAIRASELAEHRCSLHDGWSLDG